VFWRNSSNTETLALRCAVVAAAAARRRASAAQWFDSSLDINPIAWRHTVVWCPAASALVALRLAGLCSIAAMCFTNGERRALAQLLLGQRDADAETPRPFMRTPNRTTPLIATTHHNTTTQSCVDTWIKTSKPAVCPMCRARTKRMRPLLGIESQLDASDESATAAHLQKREEELNQMQQQYEQQVQAAHARTEEVAVALAQAELSAQRAERTLAKVQTKLDVAVQREEAMQVRVQEAASRELVLRQELHAAGERHATEVFRLKRKLQEVEFACQEARRQVTALRLSNKTLTLDQAENILQGEEVCVCVRM